MAYTKNRVDQVFNRWESDLKFTFWIEIIFGSFIPIFVLFVIIVGFEKEPSPLILLWVPYRLLSSIISLAFFSVQKNREKGKKKWGEIIDNFKKSGTIEDLHIAEIIESNQERFLIYYSNERRKKYQARIAAYLLSIVWMMVLVLIS